MNNYPNFKNFDYTNMYDNSYNNPYDNMLYNMMNNESNNNLYDPYNGFIRGNLFKNLYDPYKKEEPYEIRPMNAQAELLTKIDALSFAMVDLNLLLDVRPDNREAINLYNKYKNEKEKLTKEYETKYGPITSDSDALNSFPWGWIDMPWPWDN